MEVGDAEAFLSAFPAQSADLVAAADVLVYLGDLDPIFVAVRRVLAPSGLFAFSVEAGEGADYRLRPTMRFAHSETYLRAAAAKAGLVPLLIQAAATRREAGGEVAGWIAVFCAA